MTDMAGPEHLVTEMRMAIARSKANAPGGRGDPTTQPPDFTREKYLAERRFWNQGAPELPLIEDLSVEGPVGEIPIRLYLPTADRPLPVLVFCHGGGFMMGNLDSHDRICRLLAQGSGAAVCAVDYRLAPEHKFPTPLREARAVIAWLRGEGKARGLDAGRMAMGGDSAGASVTIGTAMDLRDAGHGDLLRLMLLIYGVFDDGESESRTLYGGPEYGLPTDHLGFFMRSYYGKPTDADDPRVSPARGHADLRGLPPAYLVSAGCDPLRDDSRRLAHHLGRAGIDHELVEVGGVLHGFFHLTRMVEKSRRAVDGAAQALRRALFS